MLQSSNPNHRRRWRSWPATPPSRPGCWRTCLSWWTTARWWSLQTTSPRWTSWGRRRRRQESGERRGPQARTLRLGERAAALPDPPGMLWKWKECSRHRTAARADCDPAEASARRAACIHGDLDQGSRMDVLGRFRAGEVHVLVATDVAARGLDIRTIRTVSAGWQGLRGPAGQWAAWLWGVFRRQQHVCRAAARTRPGRHPSRRVRSQALWEREPSAARHVRPPHAHNHACSVAGGQL